MTSAGIPHFIIGIAVLGMLYIALGPCVDILNDVHQDYIVDASLPMSSERADTWTWLMVAHDNVLIIVFLGFVLLLAMVSLAVHTGPTY
jgi:hypothetical protein